MVARRAWRSTKSFGAIALGPAIYDAPEPWSPWTTAWATEGWDVGPGETASLPPKWMSPAGRTVYLVFSGDDCFSVREGTVVLRKTPLSEDTAPHLRQTAR